ncbi:MAG: hypothetical protein ACP5O1_06550 [Phycisphaerae bacterium]
MTQISAPISAEPMSPPCPRTNCRETLRKVGDRWKCPQHPNTPFVVDEFAPIPLQISQADAATEEHAVCAHHPEHRAIAICAGTGNYICALCTVEIDGNTYSVQFLDSPPGRSVVAQRFTSVLPRPDRIVWQMLACILILPITVPMLFLFFIWVPIGLVNWFRVLRMRRRSTLYRRMVRMPHVVIMLLGLLLWLAAGVLMIAVPHWNFYYHG